MDYQDVELYYQYTRPIFIRNRDFQPVIIFI